METEELTRVKVPELDGILGRRFDVLDDGFVRVVDYLGADASIVQAARVSYGAGTKSLQDDTGLIRYLMRHRHTTPFEMCEIKLHVRVPMDTWRQWIRHRTASVNEYSTRYSLAIDAASKTSPGNWRLQSTANRQGSGDFIDVAQGERLTLREAEIHEMSRAAYQERIDAGVAREQARKDLPLSTYTEAYWKVDLHNLFHFLSLRMDSHAQLEIRSYAAVIGNDIVSRWCPIAWQAFKDYRLGAMELTGRELSVAKAIIGGDSEAAIQQAVAFGWIRVSEGEFETRQNRERVEAEAKLTELGLQCPWHSGTR